MKESSSILYKKGKSEIKVFCVLILERTVHGYRTKLEYKFSYFEQLSMVRNGSVKPAISLLTRKYNRSTYHS